MQLLKQENKTHITSLELTEQINFFRKQFEDKSELKHFNLLNVIRDEFEEEIGLLKIQESSYTNSQNKKQPMFQLTLSQAKQVLVRESKHVRKAVIKYLEELEQRVQVRIPQTTEETLELMFTYSKEIKQEVDKVKQRVDAFESETMINNSDLTHIQSLKRNKVGNILSLYSVDANTDKGKEVKNALYKDINGGLKYYCNAPNINRIRQKDFYKAIEYLNAWQPNTNTMMLIKSSMNNPSVPQNVSKQSNTRPFVLSMKIEN